MHDSGSSVKRCLLYAAVFLMPVVISVVTVHVLFSGRMSPAVTLPANQKAQTMISIFSAIIASMVVKLQNILFSHWNMVLIYVCNCLRSLILHSKLSDLLFMSCAGI